MSAPFTVGGLNNAGPGMTPQLTAVTGEFDATECYKIILMASGSGLAAAETVSIYVCNTGTTVIAGGPAGTTPYCNLGAAAAAQLTATLQSMILEGGFLYRFVKSITAGSCGVDIMIKPRQGS
jgi:hypothetical protein